MAPAVWPGIGGGVQPDILLVQIAEQMFTACVCLSVQPYSAVHQGIRYHLCDIMQCIGALSNSSTI